MMFCEVNLGRPFNHDLYTIRVPMKLAPAILAVSRHRVYSLRIPDQGGCSPRQIAPDHHSQSRPALPGLCLLLHDFERIVARLGFSRSEHLVGHNRTNHAARRGRERR
jgi:hypothetical protein